MNIYELMKSLKNFQEVMEEVKRELRQQREEIQRDGVRVVFNGLGEILSLELPEDQDCGRLRDTLVELINEAQARARDKTKSAFERRFGGLLGGLGLGL
ncbi:MAG: hypothetical protein GXO04_06025 [Aquificae bacterium]|nr:hypothetical protein [Aquificota bacterium]